MVLVAPEIHWNTGNIGRTCLAAGANLHLIKPLGFSLDSREVKRAGLDYWQAVDVRQWQNLEELQKEYPQARYWYTSKKASKTHAKQAKTLSSIKLKKGGKPKSRVNEAGNYTKPGMRKRLFESIKAGGKGGKPGQWSARKAQMLAKRYKERGGGYKS